MLQQKQNGIRRSRMRLNIKLDLLNFLLIVIMIFWEMVKGQQDKHI